MADLSPPLTVVYVRYQEINVFFFRAAGAAHFMHFRLRATCGSSSGSPSEKSLLLTDLRTVFQFVTDFLSKGYVMLMINGR